MIVSLRNGIPDNIRGNIWIYLTKAKNLALKHNPELFNKLVQTENLETESLIRKDIERTSLFINNNKTIRLNKSQNIKLFLVLKAYANYDIEVKYCQGFNYIVSTLLMYIPSKRFVFWAFVYIMETLEWRDLYFNNTPKLMRMIDVLEQNIKKSLPTLYQHFVNENVIPLFSGLFSPFFITIFCYNVPMEYSVRIIDLFLVIEEKIIFECLLKLLSLKEGKLLKMPMEELHSYIRNELVKECVIEYGVDNCIPNNLFR